MNKKYAVGSKWKYKEICAAFNVTPVAVMNVCKSFVEKGLQATLYRKKPEREYLRALDGETEAHLIALACTAPPEGRKAWSLRLLRDRFVLLGHVDHVSHETIRTTLKKNELKSWLREQWCIPSKADAAFVCNMEDVLEVYKQPYDPQRPLICMDEMPKQLLTDTTETLPVQPGKTKNSRSCPDDLDSPFFYPFVHYLNYNEHPRFIDLIG